MTQIIPVVQTSEPDESPTSPLKPASAPLPPTSPSDQSVRSKCSCGSFSSAKKKLKKLSLKKALGSIKKKKKPASMGDNVNSPWVPKDTDAPHDEVDENKNPPYFLVLNQSHSFDTADLSNPNTPMSQAAEDKLKVSVDNTSTSGSLPVTSPSESFGGASFVDTDEETNDGSNTLHSGDKAKMKYSEEVIQSKLELELNRLDEKLKTQKAERLSIAKEQLNIAVAEERSQNMKAMKQKTLLLLAMQLLPIVFIVQWVFSSIFSTPYCYDTAMEQSQAFFRKASGMQGVTVLLSETTSRLGSTIEDRFVELGATVESLQDQIDCSDLESVADSVDALLKKHRTIDFMIQTGNLCLDHSIESLTSLQSGNYLSAFVTTQKILPSLEKSKYGTLVLFGSKISHLVPESILHGMIDEENSQNMLTSLLYLPLQFASNKMFEKIQHRLIARDYPNIRTFEVSKGWLGMGDKAADDFFGRVFQAEADTPTALSFFSRDDDDLYEGIYEKSVNVVWQWLVPPSTLPPVSQMVLGSPPSQQIVMRAQQKSPSASVTSYFPVNTATVVTSGALAVLAMHTKSFSWWSGSD